MSVAVVTGASRGIGRALAEGLARRGWALIVDARTAPELAAAAAHFRAAGAAQVEAIVGSIADPAHRDALRGCVQEHDTVRLLINNAGILGASPLPTMREYPIDVLREVFEVNVLAPLALTQMLMPSLARAHGVIVNLTSDAAVEPYPGWGGYGAAKAAADRIAAALAAEEPRLRVYSLDPGDVRTQMHQAAYPGEDISDRAAPESVVPLLFELLDSERPSGRYGATELLPARAARR